LFNDMYVKTNGNLPVYLFKIPVLFSLSAHFIVFIGIINW